MQEERCTNLGKVRQVEAGARLGQLQLALAARRQQIPHALVVDLHHAGSYVMRRLRRALALNAPARITTQ
jgi:hypothetical protein